ncbi:MAG: YbhB/YbcL family Raf kinase inhibitor-like protein [Saprospiraceae bacterium]|nr:YbhB/YbcL family Raf kinase inhibitor-like protein [Saprospiraceae bacterium]
MTFRQLFFLMASLSLIACDKEDGPSGPSSLEISHNSVYELLPAKTVVATLSSQTPNASFRLIAGDGDAHNSDFEILGSILRTTKRFEEDGGGVKSIRISVSDGTGSFEKQFDIEVKDFVGTYPTLSSKSFEDGDEMPREFGADNGNVSPDLDVSNIPTETQSMVLIMTDLDDGNSIHWTVWNIPSSKSRISKNESWQAGIIEGNNNFGEGYTGPFPPSKHRYEINLYFLEGSLNLTPEEYVKLSTSMVGKIIAQTSIIGTYAP